MIEALLGMKPLPGIPGSYLEAMHGIGQMRLTQEMGGYDIILVANIPYSVSSLRKLHYGRITNKGLVRSPVSATLLLISSRLYVTWGILWSFSKVRTYFIVSSLVISLSITESSTAMGIQVLK